MSGICGICEPGRALGGRSLGPMLAALALPDESGNEAIGGDSVAMAVARRWDCQQIAVLPEISIVVDADILNRKELETELRHSEFETANGSLANLIARLYLKRGLEFLSSLDGPFSLALWDKRSQRLILAVDRLGVHALYWGKQDSRVSFASRVGAVRSSLGDSARVNRMALMQFLLFSGVSAPLSIYEGIERLPAGSFLVFEKGALRRTRYWNLNYSECEGRTEVEWASEVQETMRTAIHRHMRQGEPERTGAYLSGGTDSSSVVAFMNERHSPVKTFSIFFEDERYSEINFARTAAERFGTRHHELRLSPKDAFDAVPRISQYFDEPFANSSAIGGYYCARLARDNGVDCLLAGDGGDELFAGNERYASDKRFSIYHKLPVWIRKRLIEPIVQLLPQNDGLVSLPRRYVIRANIPNPLRIFSYGLFLSTAPEEVFQPDFLEAAPPEQWMAIADAHFHLGEGRTELNRLLHMDVQMTLADNDLRKVCGTAEMAGVRARFPLLDWRLAELSGRIPSRLKLKGFYKRYIFKQAMKTILPEQILHKKKHGFGVPVALWFLEDPRLDTLVKDVLNDPKTRQRGYFRPAFLDDVVKKHREVDAKNYGEILWFLLTLELWHREHLESPVQSVCVP
jgi:asparagine synthase (glutamine-hydrolysing)